MENRHKTEIDDLTRRYEQMKSDRDKLERYLKEVLSYFWKTLF